MWAGVAEWAIERVTDSVIWRHGRRGLPPKCCWKPILQPKDMEQESSPPSASSHYTWLSGRARELGHACTRVCQGKGAHGVQQLNAVCDAMVGCEIEVCELIVELPDQVRRLQDMASEALRHIARRPPAWEALRGLAATSGAMSQAWSQQADERARLERMDDNSKWRQWVLKSLESGAGALHKWLKPPAPWRPTSTLATDGKVTADPLMLLAAERAKWQGAWEAQDEPTWRP